MANYRTLEIVKQELICVLGSLWASIEKDKRDMRELSKEAVKMLLTRDHGRGSKKGKNGQI